MSGGELEWMRNYQASENSRTPSKRMRVGVSEVFFGERGRELPFLQSAARLIEKLGFDEMWLPEHVVFFQNMNRNIHTGMLVLAKFIKLVKKRAILVCGASWMGR